MSVSTSINVSSGSMSASASVRALLQLRFGDERNLSMPENGENVVNHSAVRVKFNHITKQSGRNER